MATMCIQWIRDELEAHGDLETLSPPLVDTKSLCEFVTDGRALCLLTNVVLEGEGNELPKKLERSLKKLSKFHALERVQFFIKWCRTRAKLEEHQVFTTVQLLDEVNEMAVSETIAALRKKTRPGLAPIMTLSQNSLDKGARSSASSTASTASSTKSANKLSSFLQKFPSVPVVATTTPSSKPPMSYNRVSLTSSVASSNPSPCDFEDPVPTDEDNSYNKSCLRIPSIFKTNNNASHASATSRSSFISNASSSTSKVEVRESRSRSWSSKLSAFSRSQSPSSVISAAKKSFTGDPKSSDTPPSSPSASPHNKVSIPSVFSCPAPAAPQSASKLSAFLSSVDTTAPAAPASYAPSQDKRPQDLVVETTSDDVPQSPIEDNQAEEEEDEEEEEQQSADVVEEEVSVEQESTDVDAEDESKLPKQPPSKLLAFLQAVDPCSAVLPTQKLSENDEGEDDVDATEAEEAEPAEEEGPAAEEESASVEEEDAKAESEVSATSEEEELVKEESAPEHDVATVESQETSEEEAEEALEGDNPEKQEDEIASSVVAVTPMSSEILQENERLVAENDALARKLETAEASVATKDIEIEALKQELELLKSQLAELAQLEK